MTDKKIFDDYYFKLALEGALKSLIFGLIAGFAVSIVPAVIGLIYNFSAILISLLIGIAALAATTPVLYLLVFKPNTKQMARRVDRLGLEERVVTMLELENDESYIAMRQREDAKGKLARLDSRRLKLSVFSMPLFVFILLGVFFICSVSMVTASALSVDGRLDWKKPDGWMPNEYEYVRVRFETEGGSGFILGETDQLVPFGGETTSVYAVPDIGYVFKGWADGISTQERVIIDVGADTEERPLELIFSAIFEKQVEGENEGDSDRPSETPPDDQVTDPEEKERTEDDDSSKSANQVVDGYQYYRDPEYFQYMYDLAMTYLQEGGDIPAEIRELIETYFDVIF